jgi:hypothetical protein
MRNTRFDILRDVALGVVGIALGATMLAAQQQPAIISGRVLTQAGNPLVYADVRIPALGAGAITKEDGRYTIAIPGGRISGQTVTIIARALGYKAHQAQITVSAGNVTQDFTLEANPLQLGEVVVTGAGTATETEKLGNVRNPVDSLQIQRSSEVIVVHPHPRPEDDPGHRPAAHRGGRDADRQHHEYHREFSRGHGVA